MTLSIAVQSHPVRTEMAEALAVTLGGTVVYDPEPDARPNAWRTYRECLARNWGTSHLLVIQDDADPCDHLEDVLPAVVDAYPNHLICLYVGGMPHHAAYGMRRSCELGLRYMLYDTRGWVPLVATIWPTKITPDVVEWVDEQSWSSKMIADDETIGRAARALSLRVVATVPSLVEHPDDQPSLFLSKPARFGRNPARCAAVSIEDGCDVRSYDWTATVDAPVALTRRRR